MPKLKKSKRKQERVFKKFEFFNEKKLYETPREVIEKHDRNKKIEELVNARAKDIGLAMEGVILNHCSLVWLLALRDEFGFGEDILRRVINKVRDIDDSMEKEYLELFDIKEVLKDEISDEFYQEFIRNGIFSRLKTIEGE